MSTFQARKPQTSASRSMGSKSAVAQDTETFSVKEKVKSEEKIEYKHKDKVAEKNSQKNKYHSEDKYHCDDKESKHGDGWGYMLIWIIVIFIIILLLVLGAMWACKPEWCNKSSDNSNSDSGQDDKYELDLCKALLYAFFITLVLVIIFSAIYWVACGC